MPANTGEAKQENIMQTNIYKMATAIRRETGCEESIDEIAAMIEPIIGEPAYSHEITLWADGAPMYIRVPQADCNAA